MCGIIGYLGPKNAAEVIMEGLSRLEYRGYDSAGLALVKDGAFIIRRSEGKLSNLQKKLNKETLNSGLGMGHTRWATHGRPSEFNAHPHLVNNVAVVHNGIIENYLELKMELMEKGHIFLSETDSEVISHLIDIYLNEKKIDLVSALRMTLNRIRGSYALIILDYSQSELMIGARKDSPLILGLGTDSSKSKKEFFLASDIPAFLSYTNRVVFLNDGDIIKIEKDNYSIIDKSGVLQERSEVGLSWSPTMAEKASYIHFMQKEIFEQPRTIVDTFSGYIKPDNPNIFFPNLDNIIKKVKIIDRLVILACGTSYHAGLVGKFLLEELAKIPTEVDLASEYRYRNPIVKSGDLVVAISQSGETADTLAAVREARSRGAKTLVICNVFGSSLTRECEWVFYTHTGPEIGVASTKAFTAQLVALYILAIYMGRLRKNINDYQAIKLINDLFSLPGLVQDALDNDFQVKLVAEQFFQAKNFLYLGRGICYPIALEGALKLKEISYIHAEGYPAGEIKHGPIALIDNKVPIVVLANFNKILKKVISNMQEVKSRGGRLIVVTEADNKLVREISDIILPIPVCSSLLAPVLLTIPLQLLAYHIGILRGTDVDQPRNLAKSVTVE